MTHVALCERALDELSTLRDEAQRVVLYAVDQLLYGRREPSDAADLANTIKARLR